MESECPRCKRRFGEDAELECPFCGTLVSPRRDSCPSCGIDYFEFVDHAEEQLWQKALDKIVEEIEELRTEGQAEEGPEQKPPTPAATTPAEVGEGESVCPVCHRVVSLSDATCPGCGAEFEQEENGEAVYDESEAVCPICGEMVPFEAPACPSCGAEFEEEVEEPEEALHVLEELSHQAQPVRAAPDERGGVVAKTPVVRPIAGAGLSNGISVINGRGIINGKGQTNGVQFVNGLGAVNGKDLVNGTGSYNGTGARSYRSRRGARGLPIYLRWQVIAVLVAVAIIVPSYLQFSDSGDSGPYSIDGDFGDWEEAVLFTVTRVSEDVEPEVVEWSAATHLEDVYLYARMSHEVMVGLMAQRLVLFIDSDDSAASGYSVGGVGADYKMELFGWNGSVATSTISRYHPTDDQSDWNGWAVYGPVDSRLSGERLEAKARLMGGLNTSAKFILTAQNEECVNCISYPVVLSGGVLIIEQSPTPEVMDSEVVPIGPSTGVLRLRFTCQGEGGSVDGVAPTLSGVTSFGQVQPFSIDVGDEHLVELTIDSSDLAPEQFISVGVSADGVSSTFAEVRVVGNPVKAYVERPPSGISIDGAFADWDNQTVEDLDGVPVQNMDIDIDSVGANATDGNAFFFVSVYGKICAGTYIPQGCAIPSGQGGGTVVPTRRTAEDFIRVYIDSDQSRGSGQYVSIGSLVIGADYMIEVKGLCCEIVSSVAYRYDGGGWVAMTAQVDAAKDTSRMELGFASSAFGGGSGVDFIVETTDWSGEKDLATDSNYGLGMRAWSVDSDGLSSTATQTSNQRKVFHDGTNFWSFYVDGSDTVYKYSYDGGQTWSSSTLVFSDAANVGKVSIWYDDANSVVYAVGDRTTAGRTVYLQKGTVVPASHSISWGSEQTLQISTNNLADKNTFICVDGDGFVWVMATDLTQTGPSRYDLALYKSGSRGSISAFTYSGNMLTTDSSSAEVKGSVLPADDSTSDVWAVYNYDNYVAARSYSSGSWGSEETVYDAGTGTYDFVTTAPASALVDGNGVVHVVYGDGTKDGPTLVPSIKYKYRGASSWVGPTTLDNQAGATGHKHPSISLDSTTGDLYAIWIQNDNNNIICKKYSSSQWGFVGIGGQTSYTKQHLSSVYSASGASNICWQWTQDTSGTAEVMFDKIPEFKDVAVPVLMMITIFMIASRKRRAGKEET